MSQGNHAAAVGDLLCGTNYSVRGIIGCGAMGLVVEAEHVALGVVVVVKLLHKELASRPDFVERMRLEAQALARLRSPHLVTVTDFSATPSGQPFLVMERLHGATLAEELAARGPFPVSEAIDITQQVLAGLEVAHAAGIVHRDIKPANVFLCRSESPGARRTVKILDFGIAKVLASASNGSTPKPLRFPTAEGDVVGTPRCLSPEQAMGRPVDARTDIYAVGLLLYALLAGAGPFDAVKGAMSLVTAHALTAPPPLCASTSRSIPPELELAVMRALAKAPDDRFASAALFSAALGHIARRAAATPAAAGAEEPPPRAAIPAASGVTSRAVAAPGLPAAPSRPRAVALAPRRVTRLGTEVVPPAASAAPRSVTRFGTEVIPPVAAAPAATAPAPTAPAPPRVPRLGTAAPGAPASLAYKTHRAPVLPGHAPALGQPSEPTGGAVATVALGSTVRGLRAVGRPKPRHVVLLAALGMVALALLAMEVLALRGWVLH